MAVGASGWGLWALERAGRHSVAVTHFDNTEGKNEHKLVQEEDLKYEPAR